MRTHKLLFLFVLLAAITLTQSGCWDNRDINHRILPVVMGVAKADGQYSVTLQLPKVAGNSGGRFRTVSQKGNTITKAVDAISLNMESSVDLLHLKVIVVDRKIAEEGLRDMISGFMRARDVSPKALIVICDENLDKFFKSVSKSEVPTGTTALYDFFEKNAGWNPQIALTHIWELYRSIHSYTKDVALPIVKSGSQNSVDHLGSGIIKNGRLVGQISSEETLLFNAFNGESTQGKIEDLNHASVLIVKNTLNNKSHLEGNRPIMKSHLKLQVVVLETKGKPTKETIMKELEQMLTQRFNKMFALLQSKGADIMGFGQSYRNKLSRDELEKWRTDYFPNMKMEFKLDIDIRNRGNLKSISS